MTRIVREDLAKAPFVIETKDGKIIKVLHPHPMQFGILDSDDAARTLLQHGLGLTARRFDRSPAKIKNSDVTVFITAASGTYNSTDTRFDAVLPPSPELGQLHIVKYVGTNAAAIVPRLVTSDGKTIDGESSFSITENYGSVGVIWNGTEWGKIFLAPTGSGGGGGGGGAPTDATYITLTANPSLSAERTLSVVGSNIIATDGGPNSTLSLDISPVLGSGAGTFTNSNLTVDTFGRITAVSNGFVTGGMGSYQAIPAVHGLHNVALSTFTAIGAFDFTPTGIYSMASSGSTSFSAYFMPIVENTVPGSTLEIRLYNITAASVVANSTLSSTSTVPTLLRSINLTGSLLSGENIYEVQMRTLSVGNTYSAVCKGAKLRVVWR